MDRAMFASCVKDLTRIVSACNVAVSFSARPRIEYQCQLFEQVMVYSEIEREVSDVVQQFPILSEKM
jgi:hypothetical protein